ncbi:unnamed protein product, partial [Laminaria digitata]
GATVVGRATARANGCIDIYTYEYRAPRSPYCYHRYRCKSSLCVQQEQQQQQQLHRSNIVLIFNTRWYFCHTNKLKYIVQQKCVYIRTAVVLRRYQVYSRAGPWSSICCQQYCTGTGSTTVLAEAAARVASVLTMFTYVPQKRL